MAKSPSIQLLGEILHQADLVTLAQIQVALQDQQYCQLPIGEILAVRGWLSQETADFFAERWPQLVKAPSSHPLGYYLQQASLLKEEQIRLILQEQQYLGVRFGAVAVLKGWLKQRTVDYFLENLRPDAKSTSAFRGKQTNTELSKITRSQDQTHH